MGNLSRIRALPGTSRVRVVTAVSAATAVVGAFAGVGATLLVGALLSLWSIPGTMLLFGATTGAAVAIVVGPLVAFTLLRREPIGWSLILSLSGAVIGGSVGLWRGLESINPYVPVSVFQSPVREAVAGAIIGALLMAALMRWRRFMTQRI